MEKVCEKQDPSPCRPTCSYITLPKHPLPRQLWVWECRSIRMSDCVSGSLQELGCAREEDHLFLVTLELQVLYKDKG